MNNQYKETIYCARCDLFSPDWECYLCKNDKAGGINMFWGVSDEYVPEQIQFSNKFVENINEILFCEQEINVVIVPDKLVYKFRKMSKFRPVSVYPSYAQKLPQEFGHMGNLRLIRSDDEMLYEDKTARMVIMRLPWRIVELYRSEWEDFPSRGLRPHIIWHGLSVPVSTRIKANPKMLSA